MMILNEDFFDNNINNNLDNILDTNNNNDNNEEGLVSYDKVICITFSSSLRSKREKYLRTLLKTYDSIFFNYKLNYDEDRGNGFDTITIEFNSLNKINARLYYDFLKHLLEFSKTLQVFSFEVGFYSDNRYYIDYSKPKCYTDGLDKSFESFICGCFVIYGYLDEYLSFIGIRKLINEKIYSDFSNEEVCDKFIENNSEEKSLIYVPVFDVHDVTIEASSSLSFGDNHNIADKVGTDVMNEVFQSKKIEVDKTDKNGNQIIWNWYTKPVVLDFKSDGVELKLLGFAVEVSKKKIGKLNKLSSEKLAGYDWMLEFVVDTEYIQRISSMIKYTFSSFDKCIESFDTEIEITYLKDCRQNTALVKVYYNLADKINGRDFYKFITKLLDIYKSNIVFNQSKDTIVAKNNHSSKTALYIPFEYNNDELIIFSLFYFHNLTDLYVRTFDVFKLFDYVDYIVKNNMSIRYELTNYKKVLSNIRNRKNLYENTAFIELVREYDADENLGISTDSDIHSVLGVSFIKNDEIYNSLRCRSSIDDYEIPDETVLDDVRKSKSITRTYLKERSSETFYKWKYYSKIFFIKQKDGIYIPCILADTYGEVEND